MMNAEETRRLTDWLDRARGHSFDVIIARRVFGGKPGEAPQWPHDVSLTTNGFILQFGGGHDLEITLLDGSRQSVRSGGTERLEVINPAGIEIGPDGALLVAVADEVRFGWHYYGRPQTEENWCVKSYRLRDVAVDYSASGPAAGSSGRFRYPGGPFVCIAPTVGLNTRQ